SIPNYLTNNANIYAATHFLWNRQSELIAKSEYYDDFAQLIFLEFQSNINFGRTLELLGESNSSAEFVTYSTEDDNYSGFIESAMKLANKKTNKVFAVAIGESYQHKSLFNFGNVVECILLPAKLFKVVKHFWVLNNFTKTIQGEFPSPVTNSDFNKAFIENCKPVVYVDAQHGLGNRIRAIGSAAAIAKAANRELVIVWEPDHHCECKFADLFEYSGRVFDKSLLKEADMYIDVFNYMEIEPGAQKDKPVVLNDTKDVYLRAAYTFKHHDSHWQSENEFIQTLKPTAEIQAFINQLDVENCLAAHVRMEAGKGLDHNTYDSVENWTQEGHDELHFWRDKSHFSNFIKRIDALIEENNELKIFLATDLEENYKVFEDYYGDRLIYLKRDLYDRSKEQIKYGLADAILLSKSKKLLGSTWSSFSELAMRMSKTYSSIEMSGKDF
ncbi:MAG: hypothetical protein ABJH06_07185, partial [Paraglaciecola sp.]|uniref:hypothetical protein n=1 Tax=Paraglaciecola sp. TaxID=1920173 RepID=UPI0032988CBC